MYLQSLTTKISSLIIISVLSACTTVKPTAEFEPCSVASNAKQLSSDEFYKAFAECRQQATDGNAVSQKNLAYMYYFGTPNMPKDKDKGLFWLKVAADNGSAAAEYRLELMGDWIKLAQFGPTWVQPKTVTR
jgi:TPR repeat protein